MKKDFKKWKRKIHIVHQQIKQIPKINFNEPYYRALADYYKKIQEEWELVTLCGDTS